MRLPHDGRLGLWPASLKCPSDDPFFPPCLIGWDGAWTEGPTELHNGGASVGIQTRGLGGGRGLRQFSKSANRGPMFPNSQIDSLW